MDTDGDFNRLISQFIAAGVDGFLPMDVNAGMDIVKVRELYPRLKFIGGFNKLVIEQGKDAIDREFERILPVIRSGGYVPGCDHQATRFHCAMSGIGSATDAVPESFFFLLVILFIRAAGTVA